VGASPAPPPDHSSSSAFARLVGLKLRASVSAASRAGPTLRTTKREVGSVGEKVVAASQPSGATVT